MTLTTALCPVHAFQCPLSLVRPRVLYKQSHTKRKAYLPAKSTKLTLLTVSLGISWLNFACKAQTVRSCCKFYEKKQKREVDGRTAYLGEADGEYGVRAAADVVHICTGCRSASRENKPRCHTFGLSTAWGGEICMQAVGS